MAFNFWELKEEGQEFTGVFVGQYKDVGRFKKNVFAFRVGEKVIHLWAYVQLGNLLHGVPFQSELRLTYLGKQKMPDSDRLFHDFKIEVIGPADPPKGKKKKVKDVFDEGV